MTSLLMPTLDDLHTFEDVHTYISWVWRLISSEKVTTNVRECDIDHSIMNKTTSSLVKLRLSLETNLSN